MQLTQDEWWTLRIWQQGVRMSVIPRVAIRDNVLYAYLSYVT